MIKGSASAKNPQKTRELDKAVTKKKRLRELSTYNPSRSRWASLFTIRKPRAWIPTGGAGSNGSYELSAGPHKAPMGPQHLRMGGGERFINTCTKGNLNDMTELCQKWSRPITRSFVI